MQLRNENNDLREALRITLGKGLLLEAETTTSNFQIFVILEKGKREEVGREIFKMQQEVVSLKRKSKVNRFRLIQNLIKAKFE